MAVSAAAVVVALAGLRPLMGEVEDLAVVGMVRLILQMLQTARQILVAEVVDVGRTHRILVLVDQA